MTGNFDIILRMKIDAYEVVEKIGSGGMSEVYEVKDPRTGAHRALKIYAYPKSDASVRKRFVEEGRLLAGLCHPRIVRVSDAGTDATTGNPYFVMDLVISSDGRRRSLADAADEGVDEEQVARWYDDIREGLDYIHAKGVVHRDLKLQNVLIGSDGHAVLVDFGISSVMRFDGTDTESDRVKTLVSVREGRMPLMGSVGYMAPELQLGAAATPQSDWYALGVMVYRLLTGTWCDARTDVVSELETYDEVWRTILPELLHANPEGRACPSFAEVSRERRLAEAERSERTLATLKKEVRHLSVALAGVVVLAVVIVAFCIRMRPSPCPAFEDLFVVPAAAGEEEVLEDDGRVRMPSRDQFKAAMVDALVLTRDIFAGLRSGNVSRTFACDRLTRLKEDIGAGQSVLDDYSVGDGMYSQVGSDEALVILLDGAVRRLAREGR